MDEFEDEENDGVEENKPLSSCTGADSVNFNICCSFIGCGPILVKNSSGPPEEKKKNSSHNLVPVHLPIKSQIINELVRNERTKALYLLKCNFL